MKVPVMGAYWNLTTGSVATSFHTLNYFFL